MTMETNYLALHRRMRRIVEAYSAADRGAEADYCMIDFFMCFDDIAELERHVQIAEETAREQGVLPSP